MATLDDLLSQIPVAQIAERLDVDQQTAETAVRAALPTLVGGLDANAQDPAGAASLLSALNNHSSALVDGGVNLAEVDTDDGNKIVSNVFGTNKDQVISTLGGVNGGGGNDLVAQLLPILAPIVLSFVVKQLTGGGQGTATATASAPTQGGLGDLLGGLLGGSGGAGGAGGALGNVLGSVLGGNAGGGLGGLLGGLLGGGKR
ncbi:MAG: DUF937 domain-containing protein [Rhodococcus sp. (in: high G+C Gram-positive bacteria)]|uniref:DUF937 domain-containing protein n=1 Tax=Rhodococcus sp. TaxID=1831 RepID=UPI003BB4D71C